MRRMIVMAFEFTSESPEIPHEEIDRQFAEIERELYEAAQKGRAER
jgi:hypothetical protein